MGIFVWAIEEPSEFWQYVKLYGGVYYSDENEMMDLHRVHGVSVCPGDYVLG